MGWFGFDSGNWAILILRWVVTGLAAVEIAQEVEVEVEVLPKAEAVAVAIQFEGKGRERIWTSGEEALSWQKREESGTGK